MLISGERRAVEVSDGFGRANGDPLSPGLLEGSAPDGAVENSWVKGSGVK